jgi:hypothetical protein
MPYLVQCNRMLQCSIRESHCTYWKSVWTCVTVDTFSAKKLRRNWKKFRPLSAFLQATEVTEMFANGKFGTCTWCIVQASTQDQWLHRWHPTQQEGLTHLCSSVHKQIFRFVWLDQQIQYETDVRAGALIEKLYETGNITDHSKELKVILMRQIYFSVYNLSKHSLSKYTFTMAVQSLHSKLLCSHALKMVVINYDSSNWKVQNSEFLQECQQATYWVWS